MILREFAPTKCVKVPPLTQYRLCNPSVVRLDDGRYAATVRGANYDLRKGYHFVYGSAPSVVPDTQNSFLLLSEQLEPLEHTLIDDRLLRADPRALDGIEDLRLFRWRGGLWVLGTALHYTPKPKNTMLLARLELNPHVLVDPVFIPSPVGAPVEKNWMPQVDGERLFFVYQTHPFARYEYVDENLVEAPGKGQPAAFFDGISGSSQLVPYKDGHLAVVHRKTHDQKARKWTYRHYLVAFKDDVPVRIGRKFSFEGERVEFCSGLVVHKDKALFSYGVMDQEAAFLELSTEDMERLW